MKKLQCIAASILAVSASLSHAEGYVGASVGKTDIDISGFDNATSIAITGGYKVNQNFALEASYINLGESDDDFDPVWTIEADGFNFSAVGIIPVNEKIDLFAKAGMFIWDASIEEAGYGEIVSNDGNDVSFGFGASANLTEQFSLVLEYQKFDLDGEDLSNISLGARFGF